MTRHELEVVIDNVVLALRTNIEVATPSLLDGLTRLVHLIRQSGLCDSMKAIFGKDISDGLDACEKVLGVEKKLVGEAGENLIRILSRIRRRPVILSAITRFA